MAKLGVNRSLGERLLHLKELLENERSKQTELKGELKSLMAQLKNDFNLNSLEEAEAKLEELEQFQSLIGRLQTFYPGWNKNARKLVSIPHR